WRIRPRSSGAPADVSEIVSRSIPTEGPPRAPRTPRIRTGRRQGRDLDEGVRPRCPLLIFDPRPGTLEGFKVAYGPLSQRSHSRSGTHRRGLDWPYRIL